MTLFRIIVMFFGCWAITGIAIAQGPSYACDKVKAGSVEAMICGDSGLAMLDNISLMYLQPGGSGARYRGRNETLWEHQGEALITRGYSAPEMRCKIKRDGEVK